MRFNVAKLLKEPIGSTRSYTIDEPVLNRVTPEERIVGRVNFMRTYKGIWVDTTLDTWVSVTCSRCLKEYRQSLTLPIQEEYLPTVDIVTGQTLSDADREEAIFIIDAHHVLSLEEAARQYSITGIPMKPLCHWDCPGLCSNCGTDLSQNACSYHTETIDQRWKPLTSLLKRG